MDCISSKWLEHFGFHGQAAEESKAYNGKMLVSSMSNKGQVIYYQVGWGERVHFHYQVGVGGAGTFSFKSQKSGCVSTQNHMRNALLGGCIEFKDS